MKYIPYNRQLIEKDDIKTIVKAAKGELITTGKYVKKIEKEFKKKFKVRHAISCNSGTSALYLAFKSMNLKKNDTVIMPAINFVAAANIATSFGAKIYLTDVDPLSGQMTPQNFLECVKKNRIKKIKLVISMYLGGHTFFTKEFYKLKKKLKFILLEDACHALGTSYELNGSNFKIGSCQHSDICIFSLHPTKIITAGEGGIVLTNKKFFYENAILARSHGMKRIVLKKNLSVEYDVILNSLNFRLSDLNAALALSQLKKLERFVIERRKLAKEYFKILKLNRLYTLPKKIFLKKSAWHLFQLNLNISENKKKKLITFLHKNKILTQLHYKPIYKFRVFKNLSRASNIKFLGAEKFYKKTLSIPLHLHLTPEKIKIISKKLNNLLKKIA